MDRLAEQMGPGLDELTGSTDRLLAAVDELDEAAVRAPSGLPGWSRAHVLTHLARNADAMVNLVRWAATGEETPMYPGGPEGRDADIEAGARRGLGDLRLDLSESAERLLSAFAGMPEEGLDREVATKSSRFAGRDLPLLRIRELEFHHVDLATGYQPAAWSATFVTRTLGQLAPLFRTSRDTPVRLLVATDTDGRWEVGGSGPELSGPAHALLGWLTGRRSDDLDALLTVQPPGALPAAPTWS